MKKTELKLCLGSACHTKGSSDLVDIIQDWLKKYDTENRIRFTGSLCLGKCREGINVLVDNQLYSSLNKENIHVFLADILQKGE